MSDMPLIFMTTLLFNFNLKANILNIGDVSPKVIYGADNRYEVDHYPNELFREKARSVAIKISKKKITPSLTEEGYFNFFKYTLALNNPNICPDEKYLTQFTPGDCTGFLITKNRILTAGHCIFTDADCENNAWVFDFNENTDKFEKKNVYNCKKIIAHNYQYTKKKILDYTIIELDRPTDRNSLKLRHNGFVNKGTPLVVIGHPLGLPMKIADNALVRTPFDGDESEHPIQNFLRRRYFFTSDIDTFSGNSGSPVFNNLTGIVEGMLIQGADDFSYNDEKGCIEIIKLNNTDNDAQEKILRINAIPELK